MTRSAIPGCTLQTVNELKAIIYIDILYLEEGMHSTKPFDIVCMVTFVLRKY